MRIVGADRCSMGGVELPIGSLTGINYTWRVLAEGRLSVARREGMRKG